MVNTAHLLAQHDGLRVLLHQAIDQWTARPGPRRTEVLQAVHRYASSMIDGELETLYSQLVLMADPNLRALAQELLEGLTELRERVGRLVLDWPPERQAIEPDALLTELDNLSTAALMWMELEEEALFPLLDYPSPANWQELETLFAMMPTPSVE